MFVGIVANPKEGLTSFSAWINRFFTINQIGSCETEYRMVAVIETVAACMQVS